MGPTDQVASTFLPERLCSDTPCHFLRVFEILNDEQSRKAVWF